MSDNDIMYTYIQGQFLLGESKWIVRLDLYLMAEAQRALTR